MDDSPIQTALCVIGHPIGGNPTQFVAARALASLGLDWQFLSFDVEPSKIRAAISGIDSLGFCGAIIAEPYQADVPKYAAEHRGDSVDDAAHDTWCDSLFRNEKNELVVHNLSAESLSQVLHLHESSVGNALSDCVLIGDVAKLEAYVRPFSQALPAVRSVVNASKIAPWNTISGKDIALVEAKKHEPSVTDVASDEAAASEESGSLAPDENASPKKPVLVFWAFDAKPRKKNIAKSSPLLPDAEFLVEYVAELHHHSLCIDLTGTAPSWFSNARSIEAPSITIVNRHELDVRRLAIAIHRWTSLQPNLDSMREAIEEYLEI